MEERLGWVIQEETQARLERRARIKRQLEKDRIAVDLSLQGFRTRRRQRQAVRETFLYSEQEISEHGMFFFCKAEVSVAH